ncbi:hypothetical protein [Saprospira grandis]|uniref:hypothetical protein n=1 Tax=Saprospira grandis TaxID=1008 RepID=UPI0012DBE478|nr:hypothetical protein [Saprospira grandis]
MAFDLQQDFLSPLVQAAADLVQAFLLEAAVAVAAAFDLQQDLPAAALEQDFVLAAAVAEALDLQQPFLSPLVQAAWLVQAFLDLVVVFVVAVASALAALAAA